MPYFVMKTYNNISFFLFNQESPVEIKNLFFKGDLHNTSNKQPVSNEKHSILDVFFIHLQRLLLLNGFMSRES